MSHDNQAPPEPQSPELEREKRRLERLRLVTQLWPPPERFDDPDPEPREAA
jgi:hypothetical protein